MPSGCYFEAHLQVVSTDARQDLLRIIADGCGAHMSRNTFKALEGGSYITMLTHRSYTGTIEKFREEIMRAAGLLRSSGFEIGKEIVEFAVLDTRVAHDASWTAAA